MAALCLPLGAQGKPKPLTPSPGNGTLYIGVFPDHFNVIDEATGTITGKVPFTAGMPRRTAMSRDRSRFYTVEAQMEKVEIIDIASRKSLDTFTLSEGSRHVRIKTLEPDPLHRFVMLVVRPVIKHVDRWEIEPSSLIQYDLASHRDHGHAPVAERRRARECDDAVLAGWEAAVSVQRTGRAHL
ncbi:MAG: hypothetical protein QM736_10445 [Vicinamibacterales bacterium]